MGFVIVMIMIIVIVYYIKIVFIYLEVNCLLMMWMKGVSVMYVKGGGNLYFCFYEMLKDWFYLL